jgi:sialate O-acetylesterase
MAVTIDIGDAVDIHPHNKADVGLRLARWALKHEYGQELEPSGPLCASSKRDGDALRVHFAHVGQGLMVGQKDGRNPVTEAKGESLRGFAVAGADKKWHWAEARIDGDTVVVRAAAVPEPAFVRYAFTANPAGCNLYNRDGLPASPFRSDDG